MRDPIILPVMRSLFRLLRASFLIAAVGCHVHQIAPLDPERLGQEEMLQEHFTNVYDAVASLRSAWLTVRGTDSFRQTSRIWVYYRGARNDDFLRLYRRKYDGDGLRRSLLRALSFQHQPRPHDGP